MWPFNHPLGQFGLPSDLMYNIERWADDLSLNEIAAMTDAEFGALIHQNERLGGFATSAARQMPSLAVSHDLQPITHDLLRIRLHLRRSFDWSENRHGTAEAFWVWIEDEDNLAILQLTRVLVRPSTTTIHQEFVVSVANLPKALHARIVSDRWMGAEDAHLIPLEHVVMPPPPPPHLPLLELPLLSASDALTDPILREHYLNESPVFDPVQTQAFHTLYHSSSNALLCAPSAPSRGTLLELAIWCVLFPSVLRRRVTDASSDFRRAFGRNPSSRVLFLTPRKTLARHVFARLRQTFTQALGIPTLLLSHNQNVDDLAKTPAFIAVAAPTPLLRRLLSFPTLFGQLDLIVAHDLHALDPSYELLLSRLRWAHPTARVVGSSSPLLDADDLAAWLGATPQSTYSFSPSSRSSSLTTSFQPFSTPHSASLLRSMIKPAYTSMRTAAGSTICFVPSRGQCRATAKDLVTQTATDLEESFVVGSLEMIETYSHSISDPDLAEALSHGIAVYHEGLRPEEQRLALELFGSGAVRILIASREACWTLPVRASLVIVMSAQYAVVRTNNEREIKDYQLSELLQMQSLAVPPRSDASAECLLLCQQEQAELYGRFLLQGVPVESELPLDALLPSTIFSDLLAGRIRHRQDVVDALSWTYASRRLASNPSYYSNQTRGTVEHDDHLSRLADTLLARLEARCGLLFRGKIDFELSALGRLFGEKAVELERIEELQKLSLDQMVHVTGPAAEGEVASGARLDEAASIGPDDSLVSFHQRLPRAVRDAIGAGDTVGAETFRRRILLAAFAASRIPRGVEGLEEEQVGLVRRLIDARA